MFEPQRHRGTEKAQSTSQTRRHEDTKASQRAPTQPFLNAETRRRRGAERVTRDSTTQRGPGHRRTTTRDRWAGPPLRSRAIVAVVRPSGLRSAERRPRHFSPLFNDWEGHTSFPGRREARRNRRASSASAGGKHGDDGRLRPELTCFSPAVGDRQIAGCSVVKLWHCCITSAGTSASICVICGFLRGRVGGLRVFVSSCLRRGRMGGSATPRLCVLFSVFLLCVSVPLWFFRCLGGSPGCVGGKFEIRNSKFEI